MARQSLFTLESLQQGELIIRFAGAWTLHSQPPSPHELLSGIGQDIISIAFACDELEKWDTRLLIFLKAILAEIHNRNIRVNEDGLPPGVRRLLTLSEAVPEQITSRPPAAENIVVRIGRSTIEASRQLREVATFTGELLFALLDLMRGKVLFKSRDFFYFVQVCGVESLPIVSLIAVLVGVILSFVGAVQLQMFGAQIYVANLVGLGMVLEMGALMSGIIIAGRVGASYAAQLGTMQVNEEIDALRTMGISPVGFLVLPRILALILMLPLLCVYADIMGILGGSIIGVTMLDLSLTEYLEQTRKTIQLSQFGQGILKASIFGILIGYAGCLRGMQCGRSALAVGEATTSAVVTSIVLIVVSDSFITFLLYR
ncbi:MlaE family ABC transporter permease [Desulfobulbus oligotrophicus]|jgi:phospholipid/cholesterol/gamma-HCH transport system permease protein|uniref:ABC transporter permease n=1 Tax=Desulfobulbus oligotrophicus TaxID=1909699 RepID=A0A7T5VF89_9BACT|nr:ABC transporter permease [Desulfobulbus oligotrophicus]MDY0389944.1 ABC transporter permease [Desulfobulbus oligotrophicus]QQG66799.1 ABC transporter permease [Desulfobulbus oligotrophicus]